MAYERSRLAGFSTCLSEPIADDSLDAALSFNSSEDKILNDEEAGLPTNDTNGYEMEWEFRQLG